MKKFCPNCQVVLELTDFVGEEKKNGKNIKCLRCGQKFILKEHKV